MRIIININAIREGGKRLRIRETDTMRIIINIDAIREGGKRLRIRTRYNRTNKDGKQHLQVQNAMVDFYQHTVESIREGCDPTITDFKDEGEKE